MADDPSFASTAEYFEVRAGKAADPDDRALLMEAASIHRSIARIADESIMNDPQYWRGRAEEMRTIAEGLTDEQDKQALVCIAGDYEQGAPRQPRRALLFDIW